MHEAINYVTEMASTTLKYITWLNLYLLLRLLSPVVVLQKNQPRQNN